MPQDGTDRQTGRWMPDSICPAVHTMQAVTIITCGSRVFHKTTVPVVAGQKITKA